MSAFCTGVNKGGVRAVSCGAHAFLPRSLCLKESDRFYSDEVHICPILLYIQHSLAVCKWSSIEFAHAGTGRKVQQQDNRSYCSIH